MRSISDLIVCLYVGAWLALLACWAALTSFQPRPAPAIACKPTRSWRRSYGVLAELGRVRFGIRVQIGVLL